jgi:hypothetical protein
MAFPVEKMRGRLPCAAAEAVRRRDRSRARVTAR